MLGFLTFKQSGLETAAIKLLESQLEDALEAYENLVGELAAEKTRGDLLRDGLDRCIQARLDVEFELSKVKDQHKLLDHRLESSREAIRIFADRYKISPAELRQLQVADMIPADPDKQGFERPTASFAPFEVTDPLVALNAGNDFKQTAGKFRQLRQHFQSLQMALTLMFDAMEKQARRKHLSAAEIKDYRAKASDMCGRKI